MKRKINHIVVHCAATPNGKPFSIENINDMHAARGFKRDSQAVRAFNPTLKNVGYHFVIELDGTVETGRHLEEIGAHVQGSNAKSIGICMIGTDKFTDAQWVALRGLILGLSEGISNRPCSGDPAKALAHYKDMGISIKGHRDFSPDLNGNGIIERNEWMKTCPGFSVSDWLKGGMAPLTEHLL